MTFFRKIHLCLGAVVLLCCVAPVHAQEALLVDVAKEDRVHSIRLTLRMTELPVYRVSTSGQRVDLFLKDTGAAVSLGMFSEDAVVIKVSMARIADELMVSFLLARPPKDVKVLTRNKSKELVLDISWDEEQKGSRIYLGTGMSSTPVSSLEDGVLHLSGRSPYFGNWGQFFSDFEWPLKVAPPVRYSLLPLPALVFRAEEKAQFPPGLDEGVFAFQSGRFDRAQKLLQEVNPSALSKAQKKVYLLCYGETLVRQGNYKYGQKILKRYNKLYPESAMAERVHYLTSYARAADGDHFGAAFEVSPLLEPEGTKPFYRALGLVLKAELGLAARQYADAAEFARKGLDILRGPVEGLCRRRLADALSFEGKSRHALKLYAGLEEEGDMLSLAARANALYADGQYLEASKRYGALYERMDGSGAESMARFATLRSQEHVGRTEAIFQALEEMSDKAFGSEGAMRAHLRVLDISVLEGGEIARAEALKHYEEVALRGLNRQAREEAAFKRCILYALLDDPVSCVRALRSFLRDFAMGELRQYAQSLMLEVLPDAITLLTDEGDDLQAIVLVEQNRDLLAKASLSSDFMFRLGEAFFRLGLSRRADKVFGFLLSAQQGRPEQERIFLPMLQSLKELKRYDRMVVLSDRYLKSFPEGDSLGTVLQLRAEALVNSGRIEEASRLLSSNDLEDKVLLASIVGQAFWNTDHPEEVETFLSQILDSVPIPQIDSRTLALWAEALFRKGKFEKALELFQRLEIGQTFGDQASFRIAQIYLEQGRKKEALNVFRHLAEEGEDPRWKSMAVVQLEMPLSEDGNEP